MNATRLLEHFDHVAEAPGAVSRLRRFVLDLAVRGKLVEQDARGDLPAELTKGSAAADNAPFRIPDSWTWARVCDVADCRLGKMLDKAKNKGTPRRYLRNINVRWFDFDLSDVYEMRFEDSELDEFALHSGDVLVCEGGEPGRAAVWDAREDDIYFQKAIHRIRFSPAVDSQFFVNVLRVSADNGILAGYFTGVGIKHLTGRGLASFLFPLPPRTEQYRIVAKVEELMALCDRLEEAQAERERRRDRVSAASLRRLVEPTGGNASARRAAARFHLTHLPRLMTRSDQIAALRQTILDLAVRGLIVPQGPNEESASELLRRIREEKALRSQSRGVPRDQESIGITDDDRPFELPTGWAWTKWNTIALKIGDIDHKMPETVSDGIPYVSPRDFLPKNRIDFDAAKRISTDDFRRLSAKIKPNVGDLIYPRYGTIGENRLVMEDRDFLVSYSCAVIKTLPGFIDADYQYFYSISPLCRLQAKAAENKTTQANVGIKSIQDFAFPLPPLAEQRRIVSKVNGLMGLCDRLDARLTEARTHSRRLLNALIDEALDLTPDANVGGHRRSDKD